MQSSNHESFTNPQVWYQRGNDTKQVNFQWLVVQGTRAQTLYISILIKAESSLIHPTMWLVLSFSYIDECLPWAGSLWLWPRVCHMCFIWDPSRHHLSICKPLVFDMSRRHLSIVSPMSQSPSSRATLHLYAITMSHRFLYIQPQHESILTKNRVVILNIWLIYFIIAIPKRLKYV